MQRAKVIDTSLPILYSNLQQRRKTSMVVIHHTGNPTNDDLSAKEINHSHQAQGWSAIGYHYVIRKDGSIEAGRPHWTIGAHAYGFNSESIGIHVCGNFEIGEPTQKQIEALAMLIGTICKDYGLPVDEKHVKGHRDLMPTACPGKNLYKFLDVIRGKALWYQLN